MMDARNQVNLTCHQASRFSEWMVGEEKWLIFNRYFDAVYFEVNRPFIILPGSDVGNFDVERGWVSSPDFPAEGLFIRFPSGNEFLIRFAIPEGKRFSGILRIEDQ